MPYVITDPCVGTCDTACVTACPVDCIHGPTEPRVSMQLYIDPERCISCGACEPACPVEAIFDEDDVPSESHASIEANAAFFRDVSQR